MKKVIAAILLLSFIMASCGKGISPYQAANGKAGKCGKAYIR